MFLNDIKEQGKLLELLETSTVAQLVEHLLCDQEVVGSILGQVISNTLKMIPAAFLLDAKH